MHLEYHIFLHVIRFMSFFYVKFKLFYQAFNKNRSKDDLVYVNKSDSEFFQKISTIDYSLTKNCLLFCINIISFIGQIKDSF